MLPVTKTVANLMKDIDSILLHSELSNIRRRSRLTLLELLGNDKQESRLKVSQQIYLI